ncbi:MAG TPA: fibronectin type III domain-containing protein [Terriglobales bacterium]|nr:fibronectin type III domain-containing protein [Terriglobales bacterium]
MGAVQLMRLSFLLAVIVVTTVPCLGQFVGSGSLAGGFQVEGSSAPAGPPPSTFSQGWTDLGINTRFDRNGYEICPPTAGLNIAYTEGCKAAINDWGSGILRLVDEALLFNGGGHTAYGGNELYKATAGVSPSLTRYNSPTTPGHDDGTIEAGVTGCEYGSWNGTTSGRQDVSGFGPASLPPVINTTMNPGFNTCLECQEDSTGRNCAPDSKHLYNYRTYIPPNSLSCPVGSFNEGFTGDAMFEFGGYTSWDGPSGRPDAWLYHFTTPGWVDTWQRLDRLASYPDGSVANDGNGDWKGFVVFNPADGLIYMHAGARYGTWDVCTNTYRRKADLAIDTTMPGVLVPSTQKIISFARILNTRKVYSYDIATNVASDITGTFTAGLNCDLLTTASVQGTFMYEGLGAELDPEDEHILIWPNFGGRVYDYNPFTNGCVGLDLGGSAPANAAHAGSNYSNGTYGRWRALPSYPGAFVLVNDPAQNTKVLCRKEGGCPYRPASTFASRSAGTGMAAGKSVIRVFALDAASDYQFTGSAWPGQPAHFNPNAQGYLREGIDTTTKVSGTGSMFFSFPSQSTENPGWFEASFADTPNHEAQNFGQGQERCIQFRYKRSDHTVFTGCGGDKIFQLEAGDHGTTVEGNCSDPEVVLQNTNNKFIWQAYHSCGVKAVTPPYTSGTYEALGERAIPGTSSYTMQNATGCDSSGSSSGYPARRCIKIADNQWQTAQFCVKGSNPAYANDGTYRKNGTFTLWVANNNEPATTVINYTDYDYVSIGTLPWGKIGVTPYCYQKDPTQVHPQVEMHYDDIIIADGRIPDPDVRTPQPPDDLSVTIDSSTQLTLHWRDNAVNESGYVVEMCQGKSINCYYNGAWNIQARLPANTTSYVKSGLTTNTYYSFRVWAFNSYGRSGKGGGSCWWNDDTSCNGNAKTN